MGEPPTCANCASWVERASPIATANPAATFPPGRDGIGICAAYPPARVFDGMRAESMFPETHGDQTCGMHEDVPQPPDPNDGERAAPDNILSFDRSAA